jgi:hypothetical protein
MSMGGEVGGCDCIRSTRECRFGDHRRAGCLTRFRDEGTGGGTSRRWVSGCRFKLATNDTRRERDGGKLRTSVLHLDEPVRESTVVPVQFVDLSSVYRAPFCRRALLVHLMTEHRSGIGFQSFLSLHALVMRWSWRRRRRP